MLLNIGPYRCWPAVIETFEYSPHAVGEPFDHRVCSDMEPQSSPHHRSNKWIFGI